MRAAFVVAAMMMLPSDRAVPANPYLALMQKAEADAQSHGSPNKPVLSPNDATVSNGAVPVAALHQVGIRVVPWTTNDPAAMRALIRMGVDGLISDRPDLLQQALREERTQATPEQRDKLKTFDVAGHRGGRGLRPENTLPAFEAGLDNLVTTLETDTGVSTDHVSLIWHDQFYNPQSCRHADGSAYTLDKRVYLRDVSSEEAQKTFICDKLHFGPEQKNDLALSPVAVAFAATEKMPSPYTPTYVEQLFRFVRFYADYYRSGAGKHSAGAAERARNAEQVRFNLETKILPEDIPASMLDPKVPAEMYRNHTVAPQLFVDTLCGAIVRNGMERRAEVQSFDFRTLLLVQQLYPQIPTYYLTEDSSVFSTGFVPAALRLEATAPDPR